MIILKDFHLNRGVFQEKWVFILILDGAPVILI